MNIAIVGFIAGLVGIMIGIFVGVVTGSEEIDEVRAHYIMQKVRDDAVIKKLKQELEDLKNGGDSVHVEPSDDDSEHDDVWTDWY